MIKRVVFILALSILGLGGCKGTQGENLYEKKALKNEAQGYVQENTSAKLISFKDIADLEGQTENILRVQKKKTLEQIPWRGLDADEVEPGFETGTTRSEVEILEVYKGDLKAGDSIQVEEDYFYNEASKKIFALEAYVGMEDGEEYLLLLNKNEKDYYIVGVLQGQIPIQKEEGSKSNNTQSATQNSSKSSQSKGIINSEYPQEIQDLQIEIVEKYLHNKK